VCVFLISDIRHLYQSALFNRWHSARIDEFLSRCVLPFQGNAKGDRANAKLKVLLGADSLLLRLINLV